MDTPGFLIPDCAARPGDDPIFALNAQARARAAEGADVVNATLGALLLDDGRLATMPVVAETLAAVPAERAAAYAPIAGEPGFLRAVVRDTFGPGAFSDAGLAVATPGGTGALHHAIVNLLEPGQALLTADYHWGPYGTLAEHTRRKVATHRTFDGAGRFDVDALQAALGRLMERQGRALVLLNSPCNNPTGYSLDEDEWRAVAEVLARAAGRGPVSLVVDLAYARFGAGDPRAWVATLAPLLGRALVAAAWTASKSFTQYGARIGALVAAHPDAEERRRLFSALSYSCRGTWSNCNHLGMLAVTRLLTEPDLAARADAERDGLRRLLDERVAAFNAAARTAGLRHPRYEGGFFVTVFTPDARATAAAMRERDVFVVPMAGAVRAGLCGVPKRQVGRLVAALAEGVAAATPGASRAAGGDGARGIAARAGG